MKDIRCMILPYTFLIVGLIIIFPNQLKAHCQIPCGIYDDYGQIQLLLEDAATIEKSMALISELSGKTDAQSQNQLIRWVMNKEKHAQHIISVISDYFLTQRVKPDQKDYTRRLVKHHDVIIAAMKSKQNGDVKFAISLRKAIEAIEGYYGKTKK